MPPPGIVAPAKPALGSGPSSASSLRPSALPLLGFFVRCVLLAPAAGLFQLHAVRVRATVLRRRVVPALARGGAERDDLAGHRYCRLSVTTPAPTVRPPSRMAKRSSRSMATGMISSIDIVTLSPGITISVPGGIVHTPVTSVVRK